MTSYTLRKLASDIVAYTTDYAKLKSNDIVTMYHGTDQKGFEEMINGLDATQPHYRYYNSPRHAGLFVTPDHKTARDFGRIILTLRIRAKNLHSTAWGGEDPMRTKKDDEIWRKDYPDSFRPSLSDALLSKGMEPQALFVGLLKPKDIISVEMNGKEMSREEAIKEMGFDDWGLDLTSTKIDPEELIRILQEDHNQSRSSILKAIFRTMRSDNTSENLAEILSTASGLGFELGPKAAKALAPKLMELFKEEGLLKTSKLAYSEKDPDPFKMTKKEFMDLSVIRPDPGYRLLYHATYDKNIDAILRDGLLLSKMTSGDSYGIWATTDIEGYSSQRPIVIFQVPKDPDKFDLPIEYVAGHQAIVGYDVDPKDILWIDRYFNTPVGEGRLSFFREDYAEEYYDQYFGA